MKDENRTERKNYLLWIVLVALVCACFYMYQKYNETKGQVEKLIVKTDSIAMAEQERMAAMEVQEEAFDPMLELPVEKLRVTLDKGPSCMVANTIETYYVGCQVKYK